MNTILKTLCAAVAMASVGAASITNVQACPACAEALVEQAEEKPAPQVEGDVKPKIQLAILLDTSGSMSGLIDQARTQLWKIVNEFAQTKQKGVVPDFEVALYEYGKSSIPADEGYIRQIVGLSTDLDKISEELFALKTNGGDEYCGHVIKSAIDGLQWSDKSTDYKAIFIAGNEPFTQGGVDYKDSCKAAITKGIIVNTIHCGDDASGIAGMWKDGAIRGEGNYLCIDHNAKVVHISAPQDDKIVELGEKLNKTYIPFGEEGKEGAERQRVQDANAAGAGQGAEVGRAIAKKNAQYRNSQWDLIDAIDEEKVKLEDIKKEDLPEELQKLTADELKKHIEEKRKERAELKKQLDELETARNKFVAEKRRELAEKGEETFDAALIKAIRAQAENRGFKSE